MSSQQKSLGKPKCNTLASKPLLTSSTDMCLLKKHSCVNIFHTSNVCLPQSSYGATRYIV